MDTGEEFSVSLLASGEILTDGTRRIPSWTRGGLSAEETQASRSIHQVYPSNEVLRAINVHLLECL